MDKKQLEKVARLAFSKKKEEFSKELEKLIKKPINQGIQIMLELGYKIKEIELEEDTEINLGEDTYY